MMNIVCPKLVRSSIFASIFLLVFFPNAVLALSSNTINFQGKIVRNDTGFEGLNVTAGSPACVVDGNSNDTCDFQIKYYSASSGGTLLLTETYQNTEIGQYNGAFTLSLGSDSAPTAGSYATFDTMIKGVNDLYVQLGFSPAGNATYTETFSRMPIQASAYAIKAKYASGADTAFQFDSAANSSGYTSPVAGMVYYDTTEAALKVYNGSSWGGLGSGGGSLFTDGGIFTYLTALTDHFVLGSSSYTAIGADSYTTYLSGLSTRPSLSFDMGAERLTISGSQAQSGLTVYSDYASTGGWPVATFKAEDSGFDNVVMQITQDGTGNILSLQKGSTDAFVFENPLTFYIHPRVDEPLVSANRLYNVNGTLYWNGNPVGGGSGSLWTDGGTFTYLTSTMDDVVIGGDTLGTAAFFFDVSTGNFGIGTSTPGAKLDIAGSNSTISNTTGDITISPDDALVIKANDTQADNLTEWQNSVGTILGLVNQSGYASFGTSTNNAGAMLTLGASTGTVAQINLANGLDVAAPNSGDMWWNGTSLYFFDGSTSVDLLTAGGGGSNVLSNYGTVSNGTYIGVTHDTNSYDVVASGWICVGGSNNAACSDGEWQNVQETDFTITHSLSNQWNDAATSGIIRSIIKSTSVELSPGINVGRGTDGSVTIAANTNINTGTSIIGRSCSDGGDAVNYSVAAFNALGTQATLSTTPSSGCIAPGDEILLINLQGTASAVANVGNYETLRVESVSSTTVTFQTAKSKYYGDSAGGDTNIGTAGSNQRVMLQRVPNYVNLTVNAGASFYPNPWNGVKSGVIFFRASGTVSVASTGYISAGGSGWRGGTTNAGDWYGGGGGESFCASYGNSTTGGGGQGASVWTNPMNGLVAVCGGGGGAGQRGYNEYWTGSGGTGSALGGGGGGGGVGYAAVGSDSAYGGGGAGGGGISTGGTGGTGQQNGGTGAVNGTGGSGGGTSPRSDNIGRGAGGGGGGALTVNGITADLPRLYFGSGGGGGGIGDSCVAGACVNAGGSGGAGGGIIFISATSIAVNGTNGISAVGTAGSAGGGYGGGGGGGAGGSVKIIGVSVSLGNGSYTAISATGGGAGSSGYSGGSGGTGAVAIRYASTLVAGVTSPAANTTVDGYNNYGVYNSPVISTPNAQSYDSLRWDSTLNTYGKISVQTRSGNTPDPTAPANSFVWTKYDNTIPTASDTTGTNGKLPLGTSGKGDSSTASFSSVIKDGDTYKMWYSGSDGTSYRIYYATSTDGITWTKYDNTIPSNSDTVSTNGRIPLGTSGRGDSNAVNFPTVRHDGSIYKMWYAGSDGTTSRIYYATSPDGLTWTKYDNTIPTASDTTSTNGRLPIGTSGKGDSGQVTRLSILLDNGVYKMWYSGKEGSVYKIYYATSPDGLTWTKYDNAIPSESDTTGTNGRIPDGTSGSGDSSACFSPSVVYDGTKYRMWYSGGGYNYRIFYATSSDGLTWTKYDNAVPDNSDTTSTNGLIPFGNSGRGDSATSQTGSVIYDGSTYKMWYFAEYGTSNYNVYYATGVETIGSWEAWKPYTSGTNQTILQNADTHTLWVGTNATVAEGDITRNIDYFEDEDEPLGTNITKVTSSINGGYMESTIAATNIVNYDYLTLWVRASQAGNVLRIGIGETVATEQYEDITIDVANVWQKVYWDLSDISATSRDAITKIRLTNFSTSSNVIYLDNVRAEELLSTSSGSAVASTPNQYFQYRVIFTTTNLSYQPQLENISLAYNSGYRIVMYDANNVRLYNYSGGNEYLRLEVVASTGDSGGGGGGFVNGLAVSHVADGTDAIAFQFNTAMSFTNPSSKLLSVMNNSVEKMYLDANGNLYVAGTITSGKGLGAALINNSGGIVAGRSLVTVDSSTNGAFTTTTVAGLQGALGVVQGVEVNGDVDKDGVCDNGDTCLVAFEGVIDVNLDNASSSSKGDYVYSSTTAGQGHSASGTTQTNGMLGVVTSTATSGSGYVKMVFDAQNKVTADMYLNVSYDENVYRDIYNQLANDYTAMSDAERRGYLESNQSQTVMFDNFVDSLKIDSANSTIGVDSDAKKAGLWGGITVDASMTDITGSRYLGSATATLLTSKYYDRTQSGLQDQDSTPATLVNIGVDPNWYKGVSLQTTSNLTTSYNGSLIVVSGVYGVGSEHGYIDLTVTGTTTTGITANIASSDGNCTATSANLAFGSEYAFVSGSCSGSSITIKPVRSDYKNGDKFRILSWVIEPTTTNDRGSRRDFPERSVILASSDATNGYHTIIDADSQRVWMKFVSTVGTSMLEIGGYGSSITALNGTIYTGTGTARGLYSADFTSDRGNNVNTAQNQLFSNTISGRNSGSWTVISSAVSIVNTTVNDISAAVIPNQPTQNMTVSGWGYMIGNNTKSIREQVYLPYTFDSIPVVIGTTVGYSATLPTNLSSCTGAYGTAGLNSADNITTKSFYINQVDSTNNFGSTSYYCYTWTATGQVSPRQFVATGTDGGVSLINKSDQSVANFIVDTQEATYDENVSKIALLSNGDMYAIVPHIGVTTNEIWSYNKISARTSETVWAQHQAFGYGPSTTPALMGNTSTTLNSLRVTMGTSKVDGKSNTIYLGSNVGLLVLDEKQSGTGNSDGNDEANGSVKYYTKDYITEQMIGDTRGMWPLTSSYGSGLSDASIKAATLTNNGSVTFGTGVRGQAALFNGSSYLSCIDANCGGTTKLDYPGTGGWSMSAWIKPTDVTATYSIITKWQGSGTGFSYLFRLINKELSLITSTDGASVSSTISTASSPISTNSQWYHVTVVYLPSTSVTFYVNGDLVSQTTASVPSTIFNGTGVFDIGAHDASINPFVGSIDEPFVTATALTASQIKSQYEDGLRALKGSHTSADTYNQLSGTSNDIRDILVTPDSKYMYVGTEGGGMSKIDLTSSTRLDAYTTATDPSTSTNNIETLSGRYYPVFAGDIGSSGSLMGIDSNGNNSTGTYYSKVTTFAENTNRAFLWMTASIDPTYTSSYITVSASNDNGANYVTGTLIQTNTSGSVPEYEYSFVFPTSDKNYKVKFELARGSSNKTAIYITKWGLSQMKMDTATVNGLFTNSNDVIANGSYLEVVHGQNTYDLVANGWVFDTTLNKWIEISNTDNGITQNLSNQWQDANASGIIRSIVKLTSLELAPGVDVGTGADGAITVSSNTNINRVSLATGRTCLDGGDAVNYNVTAFNAGGTTATLNRAPSTGCLNPGDEILLINLQGTNTAFGNVGNYETLEVSNVTGTTVTFRTAKSKYYGTNLTDDANLGTVAGTQRVMLQRVPNYSDVTVASGINFYPDAWATEAAENASYRASKGGVLLFRASGNVSVAGNIHANGLGFLGATTRGAYGGGDNNGRTGAAGGEAYCGAGGLGGAYNTSGGAGAAGGGAGEGGVATGGTGYCGGGGGGLYAGIGSASAGGSGGGGQGYQGAGGGAGYGSAGNGGGGGVVGVNGNTNASGNGGSNPNGGGGGGGTYGIANLTKLYLGSGGGKGVDYEVAGDYLGDGGNGGGIVGIYTSSLTVSGTLKATGINGEANTGGTYGGGGGGGTGGSILIAGKTIALGASLVGVSGGTGGAGTYYGGGAGGNGRIAIYNTTTYTGTTINAAQTNAYTIGYYSYGIYNSGVIATTNAQSYDNLKWDAALNTYGKISVETRSGATNNPTDGTWEAWKPSVSGTNITTLQNADTHTDWTGTNATVAEGDITRSAIYGFEDEMEPLGTNITKVTSSTNGGYMESTIASTDLTNYDYVTLWVRASQAGNTLRIGIGETAATEQYEDITIDVANVWQKVYWDLSDISVANRDAITKVRLTNFSTSSNIVYLDNVKGEELLSVNTGSVVASTPNAYFQYRVIFTTTNLSYQPQLENITFTYSSGFKIQITDANTVRLYNNSGKAQKLKLDVILGSAAIDLRSSEYSVNIAPSSAQIDGGTNTNSIWINKLGTGGNLLKLQTNSVDMMVVSSEGDMSLAGDVAIAGGSLTLGTTGDQGTVRYNSSTNMIEFSNDGTTWLPLGDSTRKVTLSAEYAGAVLSGDTTDNVGTMKSDNTGSASNSMNYYEWNSSALSLNDYDVRVRFTLPSDFNGWGSTGGVKLNYATESTSNTNNKVDMYIYKEGSATVDGTFAAGVSSSAGVWTSSTIAGTDLNECATAGDTCIFIMRMSSLSDNYVRIGDIAITYNRSL